MDITDRIKEGKDPRVKKGMSLMLKAAKEFVKGLDLKMQKSDQKTYENFKLTPHFRNAITAQHIFQFLSWLPEYDSLNRPDKNVPILTLWHANDGNLQYVHNLDGSIIETTLNVEPIVKAMMDHIRKTKAFVRNEQEKERLKERRKYKKNK